MFLDFYSLCSSSNYTLITMLVLFSIGIFCVYLGGDSANTRLYAILLSFLPMGWSLYVWYLYDGSSQTFQLLSSLSHISLGVDALGLSLLLLTGALFPICLILMRTFTGIMTFLLLELAVLVSVLVLDLLGFYIAFESSLILLFLLIARTPYGSINAAYNIVLYTMAGSLIFLPMVFLLYSEFGTTNLIALISVVDSHLTFSRQVLIGWGFLAVFAVKLPLIPVHLWLTEAHVASPTAGSVLLAGVLLKLGGLGLLRFMIPILPSFSVWVFPFVCTLCLISFLFSTLSTIKQVDLKKIVAYSSIAHMSLITLSIMSMSEYNVQASTYMMIAHGIVSPGLFLLVGFLYERTHTKFILYLSGLGSYMPLYGVIFFLLTCANLSFPLSPNFIAEVLCLISIFAVHELYAFVFCASQVLGAVYAFWAYNRVMHGLPLISHKRGITACVARSATQSANGGVAHAYYNLTTGRMADLTRLELAIMLPVLVGVVWLGIKPMT